jgi:secreted Zn-dependent insulinase-like peptidase
MYQVLYNYYSYFTEKEIKLQIFKELQAMKNRRVKFYAEEKNFKLSVLLVEIRIAIQRVDSH